MGGEVSKGARAAASTALHIEDLILEGALRPGDPLLAEREMALRLNVSRPTLREGLRMLEDRGLIVTGPGGSRQVARLAGSITDPLIDLMASRGEIVGDYLELRGALEAMAAGLAATRATDLDRKIIADCFQRIERAHEGGDADAEAEADADLHVALYEASHNVVLLQIMRALSGMLRKGVFHNRAALYGRPEIREVLLAQHRAIHDAVMARDPAAASRAAEDHMGYTRRALREIAAAEARLETSLRRIEGGSITSRN